MSSTIMFDRKWYILLRLLELKGDTYEEIDRREITDLKVTFTITNTLLGDPSLAMFQIYNISPETVAFISNPKCYISFHTGYYTDNKNELNVLFNGQVTNSYQIRQQNDIIWNVWARNAFTLLNVSKPDIDSIQNETKRKAILKKLTTAAPELSEPIYIGDAESVIDNSEDLPEFTLGGTFKEEFDDVLEDIGLGWQIQGDDFLVFNSQNLDPTSDETEVIKIDRKTGLLTRPVIDYTGITFTHLLNGKFKPTKVIEVDPNTVTYNLGNEFYVAQYDKTEWNAKGKFRIFEAKHRGDTRGSKWETDVIAFYRKNG
jgi:hypothetical protein